MKLLPDNATKIDVADTTVEFFTFTQNDVTYYQFDSSMCELPEPMLNAMLGLKLIESTNHKLVMINHKKPMGLIEKVSQDYDIFIEYLDDGRIKLIFSYKNVYN